MIILVLRCLQKLIGKGNPVWVCGFVLRSGVGFLLLFFVCFKKVKST